MHSVRMVPTVVNLRGAVLKRPNDSTSGAKKSAVCLQHRARANAIPDQVHAPRIAAHKLQIRNVVKRVSAKIVVENSIESGERVKTVAAARPVSLPYIFDASPYMRAILTVPAASEGRRVAISATRGGTEGIGAMSIRLAALR